MGFGGLGSRGLGFIGFRVLTTTTEPSTSESNQLTTKARIPRPPTPKLELDSPDRRLWYLLGLGPHGGIARLECPVAGKICGPTMGASENQGRPAVAGYASSDMPFLLQ